MVDSRSARVRAAASGWTVSTPTGRTTVTDSLTAMWAAVESLGAPEPHWSSMSLPAGFDEPEPLTDRRRPVSIVAGDLPDARRRVALHLAAPQRHSERVAQVGFPGAEPATVLPFTSTTVAALVLSGMAAYGHGRGRAVEAVVEQPHRTIRLTTWDGHGLGLTVDES
ncbi:hypothetical protein [Rhodococcus sp. ACT016]|uniref:hypothetical protein n=1 Tax=Rhodococcus sp. ACT016 TaxID=3134808 RepID=UPI003D2A8139